MEKSAHYSATYFLMRSLNFTPPDAGCIAYASQYTDDAVESEPLEYPNGSIAVDPIRTAHYGLAITKEKLQDLAFNIWMPFHFLPGKRGVSQTEQVVTQANSELARGVLDHAFEQKDLPRFHHALGIASHSFLDTFSHQNFSGRHGKENDVEHLAAGIRGLGRLKDWRKAHDERYPFDIAGLAPEIGHAEALVFPDLPFLTWSYEDWRGVPRHVYNPTRFYDAFHSLFVNIGSRTGLSSDLMDGIWRGTTGGLDGIYGVLKEAFTPLALTEKERMKLWKDLMPKQKVFAYDKKYDPKYADYDKDLWVNAAIYLSKNVPRASLLAGGEIKVKSDFVNSDFVLFHSAAKEQRAYVQAYLKANDLA